MMTEFTQVETAGQILTFIYAVMLGMGLCLLYDIFCCIHIVAKPKAIALFIQDVLYFAVAAVLVFCFLLIRCEGVLRLFVLLGVTLGAIIAYCTISKWFLRTIVAIIIALGGFFRKLTRPIRRFSNRLKIKKQNICAKAAHNTKNIFKRKKKPLANETPDDV